MNENDIGSYRTFFKLSPPLRTEQDRAALVAAVAEGLIDVVMSDHNPQDVEVKRLPFAEAEPGAIGLETMLATGLTMVHNREHQPAGLPQGGLHPARRDSWSCPADRSAPAPRPT